MNRENKQKIAQEFQALAKKVLHDSNDKCCHDDNEDLMDVFIGALTKMADSDLKEIEKDIRLVYLSQVAQSNYRKRRLVDEQQDDMLTAIRKLGGINVVVESDYAGRFSHLHSQGFNWSAIEQNDGQRGMTIDTLLEKMAEHGYITDVKSRDELLEKLDQICCGQKIYSLNMSDANRNKFCGEGEAPPPSFSFTEEDMLSYGQYPEATYFT